MITAFIWRLCTYLIKLLQGWNTRIYINHRITLHKGLYLLSYGHWSLGKEILCPRPFANGMSWIHGVPCHPCCQHCSRHFWGPWKMFIWSPCLPISRPSPPTPTIPLQLHLSMFLDFLITQHGNGWSHKSEHFILHPPLKVLPLLSFSNHQFFSLGPEKSLIHSTFFCDVSISFCICMLLINTALHVLEFSGSSSYSSASPQRPFMIGLLSVSL